MCLQSALWGAGVQPLFFLGDSTVKECSMGSGISLNIFSYISQAFTTNGFMALANPQVTEETCFNGKIILLETGNRSEVSLFSSHHATFLQWTSYWYLWLTYFYTYFSFSPRGPVPAVWNYGTGATSMSEIQTKTGDLWQSKGLYLVLMFFPISLL